MTESEEERCFQEEKSETFGITVTNDGEVKDARRGYVPGDDRKFSLSAIEELKTASRHICYLLNEGYGINQASTFVGNHFALSERQRLALVRSISAEEQLKIRREKKLSSIEGKEVWIDGFNTIITLEVMLSGSPLFYSMDGTIRDLAALRGTYKIIPETEKAVRLLLEMLSKMKVASVHILLDEPVSNSGRLKSLIADIKEKRDAEAGGVSAGSEGSDGSDGAALNGTKVESSADDSFPLDIQLLRDVDRELWTKENVITADAIILDHCKSWFNFMECCLEKSGTKLLQVW